METDVLIVGAGPTGLALALCLQKQGIRYRIVDKTDQPGTASRAIAVQARTLELYDQLGIADEVASAGLKLNKPTVWTRGKRRAVIPFGSFGKGLSPHPYLLMYPQDAHEALLIRHLTTPVERSVALADFIQNENHVRAQLSSGETLYAKYICGCDGAHSLVREKLGAGFPGGTYDQLFYVADVDADTMAHVDEFYFFLRDRGFLLVLPLPGAKNRFRLIGIVPPDVNKAAKDLSFDDIAAEITAETPLVVNKVHWFSAYHVHHRVTDAFRWGRAFLLGDAAHIHSPAGGQGMNTGIGDGFNLGWKLAHVLRGGPDALLDTYAMERHAFAEQLVATTDRIFMAVVGKSTMSRIIRLWVFPRLLPLLMQFNKFRHFAFVTISQLVVQYRDSALSTGGDAGERLPWTGNNFAPLRSFDWQVHVYGQLLPGLQTFCDSRALPVVVFPAHKAMKRDVIYLVRPDGYVGFEGQDLAALDAYCTKWHIDQA